MKKRIVLGLRDSWKGLMYVFITITSMIAVNSQLNCFVIIVLGNFWVAVVGEQLLDYLAEKLQDSKEGLMGKTLTHINENGDYELYTEDLYEAVEKLGYIEHELKGEL